MDEQCLHRWSLADIADAAADGLNRWSQLNALDQAVRGLDSLTELEMHPLIGQALSTAGYGVWPEERYPSHRHRAKRSHGDRCDLVLTPDGAALGDERARNTLFEGEEVIRHADALWLEVKVVAQFHECGPNARYASEIQEPVRTDVRKLARDPVIRHGAVLLVVFTSDEEIARHDLKTWHRLCAQRSLPVAPPYLRKIPIVDRLGNACCHLAFHAIER